MDPTRFKELRDAYVLGALTEEERLEFEEHLAAYPERQAEVDELGGAVQAEATTPHAGHQTVFGRLGELY